MLKKWLILSLVLGWQTLLLAGNTLAVESGTLVQVKGDPAQYFMINGFAAPIPSKKVYDCLGLKKNRKTNFTQEQLASTPKTAFLVRGSDGKIYRVDGEVRRLISDRKVFHKKGFQEAQIIGINDRALLCLPEGPPIR